MWLVTGAGGQLGSVLFRRLQEGGAPVLGLASPAGPAPEPGEVVRADLTDEEELRTLLARVRPGYVVNAGAISAVAAAHADPDAALRVNAAAPGTLARLANEVGARFVHVSTDMVFDGERAPYAEGDASAPPSSYGRSKRAGELRVLAEPGALVVRLPLLYGMPVTTRDTTFQSQLRSLREGKPLTLFVDEWRTPLSLVDAAEALIAAATSREAGILHAGGPERLSRYEMGLLLAEVVGAPAALIQGLRRSEMPAPEPRARDLSLDSSAYQKALGRAPGCPMRDALRAMKLL